MKYYRFIVVIFIAVNLFCNVKSSKRYDVLKYELKLNIDMNSGSFQGVNTITFVPDTLIDCVYFHSSELKIQKITYGNHDIAYELLPKEEKIKVLSQFKAGDTSAVSITFEYDYNIKREPDKRGIYFYKKDSEVYENLLYTMSEPSDARKWYPCWDEPNDKVLTELFVRVNQEYSVASNGILIGKLNDTDSTKIYHWKTFQPITTYLVSLAISKYSEFSHYYHKISNPEDSLEIKYYIWQPDSAGVIFNAERAFTNVSKMITAYSKKFGEYPFEKYGMAAVFPFNFGGEEHQSLTTIHRYWLCGEEMGIAHELAHQWWGDMITCSTWKDIWLNESFATYSEYIYLESKTNNKNELRRKLEQYARFGSDWSKAIYDPEGQGIKLFSDIVYQKGALVLHTLRNIIGDDNFFNVLEEYREKYEYSYASSKEFIEIVNKVTGKDYGWFFEQYIFGKGYPELQYDYKYDERSKSLKVTLEQVQSTEWPVYKIPVEIRIKSKDLKTINMAFDGTKRIESIKLDNIEKFSSIEIDPDKKIFMKVLNNK